MEKFEDLKGKILSEIIGNVGAEEMIFVTDNGDQGILYYEHD